MTRRIIDAHVHFWDPAVLPISWMRGLAPLERSFRPADHRAACEGYEVEALVFVEADVDPGLHLLETGWVAGLSEADPRIAAIVAHAPLERGRAALADVEALERTPLVKGVRRLIQGQAPGFGRSESLVEGVRLLAGRDLHFEICVKHPQLAEAIELVRRVPEVPFVLDHIGKPGIAEGLRDPWMAEIAEMAASPNVVCKLSGVATEADPAHWREEELRPYIDRVLEVFGPERVIFGSDWPVMLLAAEWRRWVEIVERALAPLSEAERDAIFRGNARRVYRLD